MNINIFPKKKSLLNFAILSSIFFSGLNLNAQRVEEQQFYNYGFENWVNEGSEEAEPAHWHSPCLCSDSRCDAANVEEV